jgi:hypothetical protein
MKGGDGSVKTFRVEDLAKKQLMSHTKKDPSGPLLLKCFYSVFAALCASRLEAAAAMAPTMSSRNV